MSSKLSFGIKTDYMSLVEMGCCFSKILAYIEVREFLKSGKTALTGHRIRFKGRWIPSSAASAYIPRRRNIFP